MRPEWTQLCEMLTTQLSLPEGARIHRRYGLTTGGMQAYCGWFLVVSYWDAEQNAIGVLWTALEVVVSELDA